MVNSMTTYRIKIPFDNEKWLYVVDHRTLEPIEYSTKREAVKAAKIWKYYKIIEMETNDINI